MCGIAGIISIDGSPLEAQRVKAMCDLISHRGPDDAGYVFFRLSENKPGKAGTGVNLMMKNSNI